MIMFEYCRGQEVYADVMCEYKRSLTFAQQTNAVVSMLLACTINP